MGLPEFDENGNLPPGEHLCDWNEFASRFGRNRHRRALMSGLRRALQALRDAGASEVWLDGSFVTSKDHPNDWDGCYGVQGLDVTKLPPVFRDIGDLRAGRPKQRAQYAGEFLLAQMPGGAGKTILQFFQQDRDGNPKGIVRMNMESVP